jgi:hypothetical protein
MSPREPSRKTRKRGSGMRSLADGFEEAAGGVIFGVADDGYAYAEAGGGGALWNGVGGVVGAFGVHVWAEGFEERLDVGLAEEDHVVDGAKSGDEIGAGGFRQDGAAGAFESADAGVAIHRDDEDVAFAASPFQIADVSDVQRIEAAIREDDSLTAAFVSGEKLAETIAGDNFGLRLAHGSGAGPGGFATDGFEQLLARDSGCAALHYHQAARDIGDVGGFQK